MLLFALQEGRISSLDDPVVDWGWAAPTGLERLRGKDRAITFRHLANMTSGFDRVEGPGEAFAYNDNAVQLYARTLMRVFDAEDHPAAFNDQALTPERLGPLEFEDGPIFGMSAAAEEGRRETALVTSPRDFARLGWLWLNRGHWRETQVLRADLFTRSAIALVSEGGAPECGRRPEVPVHRYVGQSDHVRHALRTRPLRSALVVQRPGGHDRRTTLAERAALDTYAAIGNYPQKAMFMIPSLGIVVAAHGDWSGGSYDSVPVEGSRGQPHRYWNPGDPDGGLSAQLGRLVAAVR